MECDVSVEAIIQDNSREHVAMVTEDKSVVTTNGEETVAQVMQRGYSILTIYTHASELRTKLSSHTAKLSNTPGRRNVLEIGKKDTITI